MAQSSRTKPRRKAGAGVFRRIFQLSALVGLIAVVYAAWFWFEMRSWRPDQEVYPEQGAVVPAGASAVRFETLKAIGASLVYLELAAEGTQSDPGLRDRIQAASAAGLKVGVVQSFDPCQRADPQSALFTRMVARDLSMLPPAIALIKIPSSCEPKVSDAAVTSEILTFVNQIELHTGQPVILKVGEAFETRFAVSSVLDRDLWLVRDRLRPRYTPRPWLLWTANGQLISEAADEPLEWVVVQQ
ncbi:MAG: glycoside hydrolase family 25 protein [Pseudomonadota bacterium]